MALPSIVTVQQAAQIVGVSASRVRQLVGQGKFPRPLSGLGRDLLFNRSDVRAYVNRCSTTGVASLLPNSEKPLCLVTDVVWHLIHPMSAQLFPIHVRIYTGSDRTVILLSEPTRNEARVLINWIEDIVTGIEHDLLEDVSAGDVVWIDIWPAHRLTTGAEVQISNPILTRRLSRWAEPTWTDLTLMKLNDLLGGATVDFFYWEHYNTKTLQAWRRSGQSVLCEDDEKMEKQLVDAFNALDAPAAAHSLAKDIIAIAQRSLLGALAIRDACIPESECYYFMAHEEVPIINAMTLTKYEVPEGIATRRPSVADLDAIPFEQAATDYLRIHHAIESVDEYSSQPRPYFEDLLRRALQSQASVMARIDEDRAKHFQDPTAPARRGFEVVGRWDATYLAGCIWLDVDPHLTSNPDISPRQAKQLVHPDRADNYTYGLDRDGNPVCRFGWTAASGRSVERMNVLWPATCPSTGPLPDDIHFVADGYVGDRPVYLARRDEIVGLLPQRDHLREWNFGYGGGGPRALVSEITAFLTAMGYIVYNQPLEDQVFSPCTSDTLDLVLASIARWPLGNIDSQPSK